jgi:hypothetical protein
MGAAQKKMVKRVFDEIVQRGVLLQADSELPSVVSIVTRKLVKGSWWSIPEANLVYNICLEIDDHPEILTIKLIKGKLCFIHRHLWSALARIAVSRAEWQMHKLSPIASKILRQVEKQGDVLASGIKIADSKAHAKAISELEKRLRIYTRQEHTDAGKHQKILISWKNLLEQRSIEVSNDDYGDCINLIESGVGLDLPTSKSVFPWRPKSRS